ncbi:MAG TPA: type II secretion system F family protein, partial [Candidatus Goldiibacteriota bacterium]|nr:type II secretion system F family protein [Candidatus Goldiibacteriota bacterium]
MTVAAIMLVFMSAGLLAAAAGLVIARQAAVREITGNASAGLMEMFSGLISSLRDLAVSANNRLVKNGRYLKISAGICKLDGSDTTRPEKFMLYEQASAAAGAAVSLMAFGDIITAAAAAVAAFFIPSAVLSFRVREKEGRLRKELPDGLDIMASMIEGGLSLDAAMARYGSGSGDFAAELGAAMAKMQLGVSREEALNGLSLRLAMPEISAFAAAVIQAGKSGGSLKKIIKAQAEEARKARFMELRKKAHEAPVKLLIPLMLFIFPVIFMVLF